MGRLVYAALCSLDGYTVDASGDFTWAAPDDEVHAFVNDLERPVGTYLYGRRMWETMRVWQTWGDAPDEDPVVRDYAAVWRAADKVVYSSTLTDVDVPGTRLERAFDPVAVRAMVDAGDHDVSIGGPTLAGQALLAGIVDEVHLFLSPVAVGGGTPALSLLPSGRRLPLALVGVDVFDGGTVHLHYHPDSSAS